LAGWTFFGDIDSLRGLGNGIESGLEAEMGE